MSIASIILLMGASALLLAYASFVPVVRRTIREAKESGASTDIARAFEYMTVAMLAVALFLIDIVIVPLAWPVFAQSDLYGLLIVLGLIGALIPPLGILWQIFGKEN